MVGVAKTEDGIALHLNLGLGFDALYPDFAFWLNTPFEGLGMRAHSSDKESRLKIWHDGVLCPQDQGSGSWRDLHLGDLGQRIGFTETRLHVASCQSDQSCYIHGPLRCFRDSIKQG